VQEKELLASYAYTDEAPTALSLLAKGKIDAPAMITDRILLEEILEKGISPLLDGPGEHVKVIVSPGK
jgi:threonine dehydrogenase-like Zn-dependent dehydrogenase